MDVLYRVESRRGFPTRIEILGCRAEASRETAASPRARRARERGGLRPRARVSPSGGADGPAAGQERALPPAPEASGQATTLLEGFDFTESVRGKPLMRIQADRTIGYGPAAGLAPNLYAGEKVALTVYPDDGPPVTVHSERAHYDERTRESRLSGNVRWTDKDGGLAETEEIVFRPKTRVLEAPEAGSLHAGVDGAHGAVRALRHRASGCCTSRVRSRPRGPARTAGSRR